jgi:hypothetical protein
MDDVGFSKPLAISGIANDNSLLDLLIMVFGGSVKLCLCFLYQIEYDKV